MDNRALEIALPARAVARYATAHSTVYARQAAREGTRSTKAAESGRFRQRLVEERAALAVLGTAISQLCHDGAREQPPGGIRMFSRHR